MLHAHHPDPCNGHAVFQPFLDVTTACDLADLCQSLIVGDLLVL